MRIVVLFLFLILFAAASAARADEGDHRGFAEMTERLQRSSVLRARFNQERLLRVLGRPLISQGTVLIVAQQGVLWHVEDPYEVVVRIRPGEIVEWDAYKQPRRDSITTNPAFQFMIEMLLGLLTGEPTGLSQGFDAEALPNDEGWSLRLTPQSGDLSEIVASIEISGDRFVEKAMIEEANGDAMKFTFSEFQIQPAVLNAAEQTYFAN